MTVTRNHGAIRICCFVPALLLLTGVCAATNATVPAELYGKWCAEGWIAFNAAGYRGMSDSEQYRCDITRIRKVADDTWDAGFACEGEFGHTEVNSTIRIQTVKGEAVLAMANSLKHKKDAKKVGVSALAIRRKCE
jgi:hypothetical protein